MIEPAVGVDRMLLTFLLDAYRVEEVPTAKGDTDKRTVLGLHRDLAPIKVAVLPLSRNEKLAPEARRVHDLVKPEWMTQFDDAGAIGRRYRRQDEVGTPFCVTVDFDSLDDGQVTVRERDSMQQDRIADRRPRRLPAGASVSETPEPSSPRGSPRGSMAVYGVAFVVMLAAGAAARPRRARVPARDRPAVGLDRVVGRRGRAGRGEPGVAEAFVSRRRGVSALAVVALVAAACTGDGIGIEFGTPDTPSATAPGASSPEPGVGAGIALEVEPVATGEARAIGAMRELCVGPDVDEHRRRRGAAPRRPQTSWRWSRRWSRCVSSSSCAMSTCSR